MTNTVTYHSANANPGQEWMAYVVMPNGKLWMVPAFGSSEQEAIEKIIRLWEVERIKAKATADLVITDDPWAPKQHHLSGLVWVIDIITREKRRVSALEADVLIAKGTWERGGARSK